MHAYVYGPLVLAIDLRPKAISATPSFNELQPRLSDGFDSDED